MSLRQAAQQALEALEGLADYRYTDRVKNTMASLRQALAEPEQDELRRLHAENEALKAKIEQYSAAVKYPLIFNGLSGNEIEEGLLRSKYAVETAKAWRDGVWWAYEKLKDKNT